MRWIEGLEEPTALAFASDGRLFVAERGGRLWTFRDEEGAGVAGEGVLFAEGLVELLGLAVASDGTVYLSDRGRVSVAQDADGDGRAEATAPLVAGLPVGRHQNNGIAIGPDGRLYIALGSTCNDCIEASPFSAAILALDLETRRLSVHAAGLRNPDDLVFAPDGTLWATDNGSDPPCATSDELNRIEPQSDYGWPYCQSHQPRFPRTQEPLLDLGLHTSADGLAWFESERFPPALSGGFYIALFGANSGDPDSGRRVQFAKLEADGSLTLREFASGFDRPLAVAVGPAGALYVADFGRGVVYRIDAPPERAEE